MLLRPFNDGHTATLFISQEGNDPRTICGAELLDNINDNFTLMITIGIQAIGPIRSIWAPDT